MRNLWTINAALMLMTLAATAQTGGNGAADGPARNALLVAAQPNQWVKLHEQTKADAVVFMRQAHGGSCMDTKRCRLVLFGSNTHGKDWMNSPMVFDVVAAQWIRLYPNDDKSTYKANADGLAVAGEKGDHPWAMHTFGTVIYDPGRDEMVVGCYDAHMVPGRFCNDLKDVWGTVKRHPTWTFDLDKHVWKPLACEPTHFFPFACAWDSDRRVMVGYVGPGIWELGGEPRTWKKIMGGPLCGWHNNAVYDPKNKAILVFGSNENSNDMIVYRPDTKEHRKMPTPGARPPKDQHNPMCYEPDLGRVVVLVDRLNEEKKTGTTETWLYDLAGDAWTQIPDATLPFACGMNYNLEYDPRHRACLLVTGDYGKPTAVYGLRLSPAAGGNP